MPVDKLPKNRTEVKLASSRPVGTRIGPVDDGYARVKVEFREDSDEADRQIAQYESLGYEVDPDHSKRGVVLRIPTEEALAINEGYQDTARKATQNSGSSKSIAKHFGDDNTRLVETQSHIVEFADLTGND